MNQFIHKIIIEAGDLLLKSIPNNNFIKYKNFNGGIDFNQIVTKQDNLINDFLKIKILKEYPHVNIISEENDDNYLSLDSPTWVIDPIDGTLNYSRGIYYCCISIAYWDKNRPIESCVYNPFTNELFYAYKDSGSTLNNKKINVSSISDLDKTLILLSGFDSFKKNNKQKEFIKIVNSLNNIRILSSSVLDMCYIACGKCDARIYANCKVWDLAAAKLILEEAGGTISDWNGITNNFSSLILASNGLCHNELINILNDYNT